MAKRQAHAPNPLRRANALLAGHFDAVNQAHGRDAALESVREVVHKGVDILMQKPEELHSPTAKQIVGQVLVGRRDLLVHAICADAEDIAKETGDKHLLAVPVDGAGKPLSFLPDVYVPKTMETFGAWKSFVDSLEPRCLSCPDPVTGLRGRIPFRNGEWLCDLAFRRGAELTIHPDIQEVRGSLYLRATNFKSTHKVAVHGHLFADLRQLHTLRPCIASLGGDLRLYGDGTRTPADLDLPPDTLMAWGLADGKHLLVNERLHLVYSAYVHEGRTFYGLIECPGGRGCLDWRSARYLWDGRGWSHLQRELPAETVYALRRKFQRICAVLGMGEDFNAERDDPIKMIDQELSRLLAFLELCRAAHSAKAREAMSPGELEAVAALEAPLARIRALAVGEGVALDEDLSATAAQINALVEGLAESVVTRVREVQSAHARTAPLEKLNKDARYLESLAGNRVDWDLLLGSGGRTLVFLNNLFRSPECKALATRKVSPARKELRKVMGDSASDAVLINLLKRAKSKPLESLKKLYGPESDVLGLAKALEAVNINSPSTILAEFRAALPEVDITPRQAGDRALLDRCAELGQGALAQAFALEDLERDHSLDNAIMIGALAVNLESFLAESARGENPELAGQEPPLMVERLLQTVERYRAVLKTWNKLVAKRG